MLFLETYINKKCVTRNTIHISLSHSPKAKKTCMNLVYRFHGYNLKEAKNINYGDCGGGGGTIGLCASISTCLMPGTISWISFSRRSTSLPRAVTTSSPVYVTPFSFNLLYSIINHTLVLLITYRSSTWSWTLPNHPFPWQPPETVIYMRITKWQSQNRGTRYGSIYAFSGQQKREALETGGSNLMELPA